MLPIALIIFRETLEISLILGIVLAATRNVPNRMLWIFGGFALGLAGAGLVAFFAEAISNAAEGIGQELFNAGILLVAAGFIGWTALWMRSHAKEMTAHLKKVGADVSAGRLPNYSLSAIIGLAMLREGSEIVLFVYGMIVSGQGASTIMAGSLMGVAAGALAGVLFYFGLIRLSTRYMLTFTSWLMLLLVAGLAAQAFGFLAAAGYFGAYAAPVWDSSWLLSDGSLAGKALHSLVGYSARPAAIQVIVYLMTLLVLSLAIFFIENGGKQQLKTAAVATAGLVLALLVAKPAYAIDDIHSPNIVAHEFELEYNGNVAFDGDASKNNAQVHEIELEYAPLDRWKTELSVEFEHEPGQDLKAEGFAFENFFQFWDQGEKWVDAGLQLAYGHAIHSADPDAIEAKLLLEKQTGKFLHRTNIGLEQELGGHASGGPAFSMNWSSRYRLSPGFEPGFEIHNDFGQGPNFSHFSQQEHYIGPAAYGKLTSNINYEVAALAGFSEASSNAALRFKLEYESVF